MDKADKSDWLIDPLTKKIAEFIVEDENIEYDEALRKLYSSRTFENLSDKETGLYLTSAHFLTTTTQTILRAR